MKTLRRALHWALIGLVWGTGSLVRAQEASLDLLVIGDSHSAGKFGRTLNELLLDDLREAKPGAQLGFYAACSATPQYYFDRIPSHGGIFQAPPGWAVAPGQMARGEAPTPALPELLAKLRPRAVVVALGTNLLRGPLDPAAAQIHRMLETLQAAQVRCLWVGPPDVRFVSREKQRKLFQILDSATRAHGCGLIDSRRMTRYPEQCPGQFPDRCGDGIHYDGIVAVDAEGRKSYLGLAMAVEWAEKVSAEISGWLAVTARPGDI